MNNESILVNRNDITIENIREIIGNSLSEHKFHTIEGDIIEARVKITTRNGLIHTKRLHIMMYFSNGKQQYLKENKNGTFTCTWLR